MKKLLFRILIVAVLTVLLLTVAVAEENTYYISELDMELTIPSGYTVLTRDLPETDSAWKVFGTSKTELLAAMEADSNYFYAITGDLNQVIDVTVTEMEDASFNNLSESEMIDLANMLAELLTEEGYTVYYCGEYSPAGTKFLVIEFYSPESDSYVIQYSTGYGTKTIDISFRSYAGAITEEQQNSLRNLIKSVKLDAKTKPQKKATLFLYVDHEADVSFTVPGNWEKGQLVDIENASGSEFYSEDYPESYITYWSSDLWEQQTDEEKEENPRSVINNADVTYSDIAQMYDLTRDEVSEVTYNGAEYFKVVTDAETEPVTQLVRFDNGWMYEFEFVGTEVDAAYADFEKLLDSVKYPNRAEAVPEKEEKSEAKTDKGSYSMIVVALAILAAAGLVVLVIGIIAENRNKQRQEKIDQRIVVVCKDCGHKLSGDSQFCPYCGAKIRKKDRLL